MLLIICSNPYICIGKHGLCSRDVQTSQLELSWYSYHSLIQLMKVAATRLKVSIVSLLQTVGFFVVSL